jgi:hypothetical protein
MSTDIRNFGTLMIVGLVPFTLAAGWGHAGDTSVMPWALGFGAQAVYVVATLGWRRWKPAR